MIRVRVRVALSFAHAQVADAAPFFFAKLGELITARTIANAAVFFADVIIAQLFTTKRGRALNLLLV